MSRAIGINWRTADFVPSATSNESWTSPQKAWNWPDTDYRELTTRRLVKAGVLDLADPRLGSERLERLEKLMAAIGRTSPPGTHILGEWVTQLAKALRASGASSRRWSSFYSDIHKAFGNHAVLRSLRDKAFLKGRNDDIYAPSTLSAGGAERPVFVRQDGGARSRDRERAPLPPTSIAREFRFLDDTIILKPELVTEFVRAGLLRRYDALQVLEAIPTLFGDKPASAKRQAVLRWAYDVWRAEGSRCEKLLRTIDLHVETRTGWQPASRACFGEGWTRRGNTLATYLAEASRASPDCELAAGRLLLADAEWAPRSDTARRSWVEFLRAVGVRDGLPLIADETVKTEGAPSWLWDPFLSTKEAKCGRDEAWIAACRRRFPNPYTPYSRKGDLWRIPGQIEHASLPPEARERLAELIVVSLRDRDQGWLTWRLGRYDRSERDWNEQLFPTPAASFIAAAAWMPVASEVERFEAPANLWFVAERRQRSHRFVPQPRERLVEMIEDDAQLLAVMLARPVALRDWARPDEAPRKLGDLGRGCSVLEARDRVSFRRLYQRTWAEAVTTAAPLPATLPVAVTCRGHFETMSGDTAAKPVVYVTADTQHAEARAIGAAGQAILEVGEHDLVAPVISLLQGTGGFDVRRIDQGQIEIRVDGEEFIPSLTDPLLASDGREWLAEAAVLANELLGRELERQISSTLIEQRFRRIRFRSCDRIALCVDGNEAEQALSFYAYMDDETLTLLIGNGATLTWSTLGYAAPHIASMLDRRMRSLEMLVLRLAADGATPDPASRPSDEALARALQCRVELVHEHTLALRADSTSLTGRLMPLVACLAGIDEALALQKHLGASKASRSDIIEALEPLADRLTIAADAFVELVLTCTDLAELRRRLGIAHGDLNRTLMALGLPILSNEAELRRLFETWKDEARSAAIDRLRRFHWPSFAEGKSLAAYVEHRSLEFIAFLPEWIIEFDQLDRTVVEHEIDEVMTQRCGPDSQRQLEPLNLVRPRCRRVLQKHVEAALPVVRAWCARHNVDPGPWREGTLEILKAVDGKGLFDFAPIAEGGEIPIFVRASVWPTQMPPTLSMADLGLDPEDLLGEERRAVQAREDDARRRRSIAFAGVDLDTHGSDFAERLIDLAQQHMTDDAWLTRSRKRFTLAAMVQAARRTNGDSGGSGGRRRERLSDDTKIAMGLASEYLAGRFLAAKHKDRYDQSCWVSRYRGQVATDGAGDDALGFDFRVRTLEVEWRYEVKSSLEDSCEFEFTANEMRVAAECAADTTRRYRILYVPFVFDPTPWRVMELPNPMTEAGRKLFRVVGAGATRYRFEPR